MATKKSDIDNKTRTTAGGSVNTTTEEMVNKAETVSDDRSEAAMSAIDAALLASIPDNDKGAQGEDVGFVPEGTKSPAEEVEARSLELLKNARKAVETLDSRNAGERERRQEYNKDNKDQGRNVIKQMLRFVESFKGKDGRVDEGSLSYFLDKNVGEAHGGAKSPYHRISKYCAVSDTAKVLISKRSYVLDVLVNQNIGSDDLDARFDLKEEIGPDKIKRSGMQKYILIYELEKGVAKDPAQKYKNMKPDDLIQQTQRLISELLSRQMLPDDLVVSLNKQLNVKLQEVQ